MQTISPSKTPPRALEIFDVPEKTDTYAFDVYQKLLEAKRVHQLSFLVIGRLLKIIRDERLYEQLDYLSFKEFISSPEISYSKETAYMYIRVYEFYIEDMKLDESQIIDIPPYKLLSMIPVLREKNTKDEAIEEFNQLTSLGHKDFRIRINQAKGLDKPIVWYSKAEEKWFVQYYEDRTELKSLGNYKEYQEL